ncbi:hypothetical protein FKW77_009468 [Venturia effusa]|uniref:Uncharacterized protein n=1 Tax=Venturia effusa TaxID=50376 RepID=A0A517L033_9PEZI|nr:hypothetical protein FKW77_009468 [Venturia effusa]
MHKRQIVSIIGGIIRGASSQTSTQQASPTASTAPTTIAATILPLGISTSFPLPLIVTPGAVYGVDGKSTSYSAIQGSTVAPIPAQYVLSLDNRQSIVLNGATTPVSSLSATPTTNTGSSTTNTGSSTSSGTSFSSVTTRASSSTASMTSVPPVSEKPSTSKAGLEPGPTAGLAIGMLFAGALIAAACFLLFNRRQKGNAARAGQYGPTMYTDEHDLKHPTKIGSTPMGAIGGAAILENNLPQPKEDNAIIGDLSRIKSRIEGHVESYYATAGANNQAVAQALRAAVGSAFPVSMAKLQELLANPRKRPVILRAAIAWIIVSRIGFGSASNTTFLPALLAGLTRDLSASRMDEPARAALLSKWRQITAALSGNIFSQEMSADDPRSANVNNALELADTFLRPCAKDSDHEKRLFNLEEIMKRAARFGFLLFSQPCSFDFEWTDNGSRLVVFPGLLQVSDEHGRPVAPPRVLGSTKEVVTI